MTVYFTVLLISLDYVHLLISLLQNLSNIEIIIEDGCHMSAARGNLVRLSGTFVVAAEVCVYPRYYILGITFTEDHGEKLVTAETDGDAVLRC